MGRIFNSVDKERTDEGERRKEGKEGKEGI